MRTNSLLVVIALATGCAGLSGCGPVEARTRATRARLSLLDRFEPSHTRPALPGLDFQDREDERFLPWGFHGVAAKGGAWVEGRAALIEVPLVASTPVRLSLTVAPLSGLEDELPRQSVRLLWNEHDLKGHELLEEDTIEVDLTADQVHVGINRLTVLPKYWVVPRKLGASKEARSLGVKCKSLTVECERPSRLGPEPRIVDGALHQTPGHLVTWPLWLPHQPTVTVRGRIAGDFAGLRRAVLTFSVEDEKGAFRILEQVSLPELESPQIERRFDLSDWTGRPVNLSLALDVTAEAGAELGALVWEELFVEGTREVASDDAVEQIRGPHNVLVVLFDTLRADRIGPYGGDVQTPFLDRLAASGVTVEDAQSTSSWTRPAVASLFTSLYPTTHRIHEANHSVPEHAPLLADLLRDEGYRTLSVINNPQISPLFGFGTGFDELHEIHEQSKSWTVADPAVRARKVFDNTMKAFFAAEIEKPFFLYLHEIDPHSPYRPQGTYRDLYRDGSQFHHGASKQVTQLVQRDAMPIDAADLQWMDSQYRGEISYMDAYLAALIQILEQAGHMQDTLVVFVSDHGEEFMEHGGIQHGRTLHGEMLDVPMILALDRILPANRRLQGPVDLVDVAPTILDLVGIPAPPVMQGRSLLPAILSGQALADGRATYARVGVDDKARRSIRAGGWKLILRTDKGRTQASLFDLDSDPGEQIDVYAQRPAVGRVLRAMLAEQDRRNQRIDVGEGVTAELNQLDASTLRQLQELGYLK